MQAVRSIVKPENFTGYSLIRRPLLTRRVWVNNVKMTPLQVEKKELYKNNGEITLLGAGVDSLIQHLSCASNIKRLWLDYVKMTPQKVMGVGISSMIQHLS